MDRIPKEAETVALWRARYRVMTGSFLLVGAGILSLAAQPGQLPFDAFREGWALRLAWIFGTLLGMVLALGLLLYWMHEEQLETARILKTGALPSPDPSMSVLPAIGMVVYGDIAQTIFDAIVSFLTSIATGIENFFGTIFQSFADLISQILNAPVQAVDASFVQLTNWTTQFGPFAPIIVVLVTAATIIIVIFLVWWIGQRGRANRRRSRGRRVRRSGCGGDSTWWAACCWP
jgi:hypothetical protein